MSRAIGEVSSQAPGERGSSLLRGLHQGLPGEAVCRCEALRDISGQRRNKVVTEAAIHATDDAQKLAPFRPLPHSNSGEAPLGQDSLLLISNLVSAFHLPRYFRSRFQAPDGGIGLESDEAIFRKAGPTTGPTRAAQPASGTQLSSQRFGNRQSTRRAPECRQSLSRR